MKKLILLLVVAVFFSSINVFAADVVPCELPSFTIGRTPVSPQLDGRLDDAAWKYATAVGGFKAMAREPALADDSTQVFMTYDSNNLYIAFKSALRGKRPRTSVMERDTGVWGDDSIEIIFVPPGLKEGQRYHTIINSAGTIYDAFEGGLGTKWNANWKIANYVWDFEWTVEMSVPLADFDINNPVGGKWKLNLGRTYEQRTAWAYTSRGYNDLSRFGTLIFAENPVVNQLSVIDGLKFGDVVVKGKLFNLTQEKKSVKIELRIGQDSCAQSGLDPLIQNIDLDPGQEKQYSFETVLKDLSLNSLHLNILENNTQIYKTVCPFTLKKFQSFAIFAPPDSDQVIIEAQISRLDSNGPVHLKVNFADANDKIIKNMMFEKITTPGQILTASTKEMPLGTYKVTADFLEADLGKLLDSVNQNFQKNPTPQWYTVGKDLGRKEIILPPFEPAGFDNNSISIWGRKYILAKNGFLLDAIQTQNQALLNGHISLTAGSEKAVLVKRDIEDIKPYHVIWNDTYKLGSCTAKCKFTAEYDGMVKVELVLTSQATCDINFLSIEFPVGAQFSKLCHYSDNYYGASTSGAIPTGGLNIDFNNYVWIGNTDVGLMWFSEGPLNWNFENKPITLNSSGLRINFINTKTRIDKPIEIVFGIMATPVRPILSDWHAYNDVPEPMRKAFWNDYNDVPKLPIEDYYLNGGAASKLNIIWYSEGRTDDGQFFRDPDDGSFTAPLNKNIKVLKNCVDSPQYRNHRNVYMQYFSGICPKATDYEKYISFWKRLPVREADFKVGKRPQDHVLVQTCYKSCIADYMLYGIKYLVDTTGIDGMYFDGLGVTSCENHLHGCTKHIINGKQVDITPIFSAREFHKRLATMLYELKGDRAFVISHISGCIALPILSFTQATLDGESPGRMSSHGAPPITELTTYDYWLAHTQGAAAGIAPAFIIYTDKMKPTKQSVYRNYLTMFLPHGVPFLGNDIASDPIPRNLTLAIVKAQAYIDISKAEFHGYWKSSDINIEPAMPDVVSSYYINKNFNPERVMVIISNRGKREAEIKIKLSKAAFGELEGVKAFSVSDDYEKTFAADNELDMQVGREDFRAFVIIRKDTIDKIKHPSQIEPAPTPIQMTK